MSYSPDGPCSTARAISTLEKPRISKSASLQHPELGETFHGAPENTDPAWQPPNFMTFNGGSATYRKVPDVAAVGDPITGVAVYSRPNGGWIQIGGTSASAPIWAGFLSVMNSGLQYLGGQQLGFFNPTLYNVSWLYSV